MTTTSADAGPNHASSMKQLRTWAQIARLSSEAMTALDAGKPKDARGILAAIRGVALNADKEGV